MATDDDAIRVLLLSHGISARAAHLLVARGAALVREAKRLQAEVAAILDAQTGEATGGTPTGEAGEVDVTEPLGAMRPGRSYVALHTHRQSTSFSDRDLEVLLTNVPLRTIIALGWDGSWYALSKTGRVVPASVAVAAFRRALSRVAPAYLGSVRAGQLTPEEVLRQALQDVWRLLSTALGLRCDQYQARQLTA